MSAVRPDQQQQQQPQQQSEAVDLGGGTSLSNKKPSSDKLMFVNELYAQIDELRREVAQRGVDIEAGRQELTAEVEAKRKLAARVDELMAFIDRSKKFQADEPDSATNTEYLKNCVFRFMATSEHSERRRLAPVISTILKLTHAEKKTIESALLASEANDMGALGAMATTSFGSLFGFSSPPQPASVANTASTDSRESGVDEGDVPVPGLTLKRGRNKPQS